MRDGGGGGGGRGGRGGFTSVLLTLKRLRQEDRIEIEASPG